MKTKAEIRNELHAFYQSSLTSPEHCWFLRRDTNGTHSWSCVKKDTVRNVFRDSTYVENITWAMVACPADKKFWYYSDTTGWVPSRGCRIRFYQDKPFDKYK